ncbi:DoxX family protein [Maritalea mediterranea]|uniref:DoxX family membrane protein n=1 Tax=Maritalea mediterranea TaxID=2909667 RepID=A0ABS9EBG5_9HYPH|nr:hypothetical protein [Maritalea mediterranea]MCF4099517.1 hypothetical protein [Maritalea mediterranea]
MQIDDWATNLLPYKNLMFLSLILIGPSFMGFLLRWAELGPKVAPPFWGRVGIALFLVMTASAHFTDPLAMAAMLPGFVPFRAELVVLTGFLELGLAALLLYPPMAYRAGWAIIIMLMGFLPANIYAALNHVDFGGAAIGPAYLLVRVPFQLLIVGFVYWACLRVQHVSVRESGALV